MTNNEARDMLIEQYPDCYIDVEAICRYYGSIDNSKRTDFRICVTSKGGNCGDIYWQSGNNLESLLQGVLSLKLADAPAQAVSEQ